MIERTGSVFDTEARVIGHGVNTVGVMGAGIAKQFKDRFRGNYEHYSYMCRSRRLLPGEVLFHRGWHEEQNQAILIANMATQDAPGRNARYGWVLDSSLKAARAVIADHRVDNVVAVPEIGCGIGGLHWGGVKTILTAVELALDNEIEFEVWHYEG